MEKRRRALLACLIAFAAIFAAAVSWFNPLEYDEVFTFYVSKLNGFGEVYRALANGADDHPPLDYWLRHAGMALFGGSDFALRIPSILAFACCVLCLYAFVRKPWGNAGAFAAVGIVLLSEVSAASYVGRSYILIALATTGGLVAWRSAAAGIHRKFALSVIAFLFFCSPCLHYYAIFHLLAICMAEVVRSLRRRRIDWPLWIAFSACLLGLPVIWPLLSVATAYVGRFWTPVSLRLVLDYYPELLGYATGAGVVFLILVSVIRQGDRQPLRTARGDVSPERAAAIYLVLVPFVIFAVAKFTHGMQAKYSISFPIGAAMLMADSVAGSQRLRCIAAITFAGLGILSLPLAATKVLRNGSPAGYLQNIYRIAGASSLPVVIDNPHTFVQGTRRAPAEIRTRLIYLYSFDSAAKWQGNDTDDRAIAGLSSIAPMQAVAEESFLRGGQPFLLLHDGGWLLKDLLQRGLSITVVASDMQLVLQVNARASAPEKPRQTSQR